MTPQESALLIAVAEALSCHMQTVGSVRYHANKLKEGVRHVRDQHMTMDDHLARFKAESDAERGIL